MIKTLGGNFIEAVFGSFNVVIKTANDEAIKNDKFVEEIVGMLESFMNYGELDKLIFLYRKGWRIESIY